MVSSSSGGGGKTRSAARSHSVLGRSSSCPPCGGRQTAFICALYAGRDAPSRLRAAIWLPGGFCEECFLGPRKCKRTQTRGRGRGMESFAVLPWCPLLIGRGREVVYGPLQASPALLTLVRRNNKASLQPCFVAVSLYFSSRVMATPLNPSDNWPRLGLDLSLFARPQR